MVLKTVPQSLASITSRLPDPSADARRGTIFLGAMLHYVGGDKNLPDAII
jgi:hypothetical protein